MWSFTFWEGKSNGINEYNLMPKTKNLGIVYMKLSNRVLLKLGNEIGIPSCTAKRMLIHNLFSRYKNLRAQKSFLTTQML